MDCRELFLPAAIISSCLLKFVYALRDVSVLCVVLCCVHFRSTYCPVGAAVAVAAAGADFARNVQLAGRAKKSARFSTTSNIHCSACWKRAQQVLTAQASTNY